MHALTGRAATLLKTRDPRGLPHATGIGPPWEYVPTASQFNAREGVARPIVRERAQGCMLVATHRADLEMDLCVHSSLRGTPTAGIFTHLSPNCTLTLCSFTSLCTPVSCSRRDIQNIQFRSRHLGRHVDQVDQSGHLLLEFTSSPADLVGAS